MSYSRIFLTIAGSVLFFIANTPASHSDESAEVIRIEAGYDAVDSKLFTMRSFIEDAQRVGGTLASLARAIEEAEGLEAELIALRARLNALRAGEGEEEETDEGAEEDPDNPEETGLDDAFDEINLADGQGNGENDEEWDDLEIDADANPVESDYVDNTDEGVAEDDDGWDDVDEVDGIVVGANEDHINAVRDHMAQQVEGDKNRINANVRQSFAQVQADREAERIRKEQARAAFAASMQELADGLSAAYYGTPSSPSSPSSGSDNSYSPPAPPTNTGGYSALLNKCIDAKYAAARGSGFPIMDPNMPRFQCRDEIKSGGKAPTATPRPNFGQNSNQGSNGGDKCTAVAKGSKSPKRWGACCRAGGEIRYNAFTTPDGSRTGMSAYRCMQKGKPDEPKYRINID